MKAGNDYFYEDYRFAEFYDDQYGMVKHDIPFWLNMTSSENEILEIACGTGRVSIPLIKAGKKVDAVDYSGEMLDILKGKLNSNYSEYVDNINLYQQDMRYLKLNKKYNLIIITSNSLNHIETNTDLDKTLQSIRNHLNDDGLLIFDILNPKFEFLLRNPEGKYSEEILKQEKTGRYFKTWENNIYSYSEQINYVTYFYQFCNDKGVPTTEIIEKMRLKVRLFYPQEIHYIISNNGFEIIDKYDWYDKRSWEGKTGEQLFVLRKIPLIGKK